MAWVGASRPSEHAEPPLLPGSTRRKLLGEGAVGLAYLESRAGWPVTVHAVKYIPKEAVAEVRPSAQPLRPASSGCLRVATERASAPQDAHAMRRELQNLLLLKHPNIVAFYGAEATPDCTHLALLTEAVLGPGEMPWRLTDCMASQPNGRLAEPLARQVVAQLGSALAYAHEHGIVHRDLTLDNVLVAQSPDGAFVVKLLDFGSSKNVFASMPASGRRTDAAFTPPEQLISEYNASRGLPLGHAPPLPGDMWALGILLLCALMGVAQLRAAVQAERVTDFLALAVAKGLVPFVRRLVLGLSGVSSDAQLCLLLLLDENPDSRLTAQQLQAHAWLAPVAYVPPMMSLPCVQQTRDQLVDLVNAVAVAGGGEPIMNA